MFDPQCKRSKGERRRENGDFSFLLSLFSFLSLDVIAV